MSFSRREHPFNAEESSHPQLADVYCAYGCLQCVGQIRDGPSAVCLSDYLVTGSSPLLEALLALAITAPLLFDPAIKSRQHVIHPLPDNIVRAFAKLQHQGLAMIKDVCK